MHTRFANSELQCDLNFKFTFIHLTKASPKTKKANGVLEQS